LGLVDSATKWDLDYLVNNLGDDAKSVYISSTHNFMYYNEVRCGNFPNFRRPTDQADMTMPEFVKRFYDWKPGKKRLYFQQVLTGSVGPKIYDDFRQFRWDWLANQKEKFGWEELTSNLLLIGQPGNVTPAHYDEQQNLFAQVHGCKRVLLFHPKFFQCLYPYPFHHPCDRQSQVSITTFKICLSTRLNLNYYYLAF